MVFTIFFSGRIAVLPSGKQKRLAEGANTRIAPLPVTDTLHFSYFFVSSFNFTGQNRLCGVISRNMVDREQFASSVDKVVEEAISAISKRSVVPPPGQTAKQQQETHTSCWKDYAEALTKRKRELDEQDQIVATYFKDPGFNTNTWRMIAWVDTEQLQKDIVQTPPLSADHGLEAMPMQHRNGGHFSVKHGEIAFNDETASRSFELLDTSMQHVKNAWNGTRIQLTGDQQFKDISWALAQKHGIKVEGFMPDSAVKMTEKERKDLAERMIADYQKNKQEPKRPEFLSWPTLNEKLAA